MKKFLTTLLSLAMLVSLAVPSCALEYGEEWEGSSTVHTTKFKDVPSDHWAYENILRVVDKGWFSGYPDGTFNPSGSITRAEALTVFVKFLGMEIEDITSTSYHDVDVNAWYAPYVEAGKDLLPSHSTPSGQTPFRPTQPITREDTMYALVVALGYDTEVKHVDESVLNMFKDQNSISRNVRPYVAYAVQKGLVSGKGDGVIGGQDPLTRAEFATLLYRGSMYGFNDTPEAKLQNVSVTPTGRVELNVGEEFTITATAAYSDGSKKAYTNAAPYNADDNAVVSINDNRVTAKKEGSCEIKFRDENLKDQYIVVIVTRGSGALALNLSDMEAATSASYIIVSGTAKDTSGARVTLTCNNRSVAIEEDGTFEIIVPLELGENTIEVTAVSESGSTSSKSFTVSRFEE